jgi:hypothetical protein
MAASCGHPLAPAGADIVKTTIECGVVKVKRPSLPAQSTTAGPISLVSVDRSHAPVAVEAEVRTCYDCHSDETVWPWYSQIAPCSWLVAHNVHEGREALHFPTWHRLTAPQQVKQLSTPSG